MPYSTVLYSTLHYSNLQHATAPQRTLEYPLVPYITLQFPAREQELEEGRRTLREDRERTLGCCRVLKGTAKCMQELAKGGACRDCEGREDAAAHRCVQPGTLGPQGCSWSTHEGTHSRTAHRGASAVPIRGARYSWGARTGCTLDRSLFRPRRRSLRRSATRPSSSGSSTAPQAGSFPLRPIPLTAHSRLGRFNSQPVPTFADSHLRPLRTFLWGSFPLRPNSYLDAFMPDSDLGQCPLRPIPTAADSRSGIPT